MASWYLLLTYIKWTTVRKWYNSFVAGKKYICIYVCVCIHIYIYIVLFSRPVISDSLQPHGLQHARLLCPSPFPWACPSSCPLNQWCHPTISCSVASSSDFSLSQHQGLSSSTGLPRGQRVFVKDYLVPRVLRVLPLIMKQGFLIFESWVPGMMYSEIVG